jgi:hypothetical protein
LPRLFLEVFLFSAKNKGFGHQKHGVCGMMTAVESNLLSGIFASGLTATGPYPQQL